MNIEAAERLLQRALRFRQGLSTLEGVGSSWDAKASSGEIHRIVLNGLRDPEELEDELLSAYVWLWSLKDYVKALKAPAGKVSNWIENEINLDPNISLAADIANLQKHGILSKSRSGEFPIVARLRIDVPQASIEKITILEREVQTKVCNPEKVELSMDITDKNGVFLADGLNLIDYSLHFWENILEQVNARDV